MNYGRWEEGGPVLGGSAVNVFKGFIIITNLIFNYVKISGIFILRRLDPPSSWKLSKVVVTWDTWQLVV